MDLRPTLRNFVTAKTPRGLRLAMLRNNSKKGFNFKYRDIQFVKGKWYAWYEEYLTSRETVEDLQ